MWCALFFAAALTIEGQCQTLSSPALPSSQASTLAAGASATFGIETYVTPMFKLWHIIFMAGAGVLAIIIFVCCIVEFRVPRTKEEIEANYMRRKMANKYADKIGRMEFNDLPQKPAESKGKAGTAGKEGQHGTAPGAAAQAHGPQPVLALASIAAAARFQRNAHPGGYQPLPNINGEATGTNGHLHEAAAHMGVNGAGHINVAYIDHA